MKETKKEWLDRILDLFHGLDDGRMEHITAAPSSMMAAAPAMVMAFIFDRVVCGQPHEDCEGTGRLNQRRRYNATQHR